MQTLFMLLPSLWFLCPSIRLCLKDTTSLISSNPFDPHLQNVYLLFHKRISLNSEGWGLMKIFYLWLKCSKIPQFICTLSSCGSLCWLSSAALGILSGCDCVRHCSRDRAECPWKSFYHGVGLISKLTVVSCTHSFGTTFAPVYQASLSPR